MQTPFPACQLILSDLYNILLRRPQLTGKPNWWEQVLQWTTLGLKITRPLRSLSCFRGVSVAKEYVQTVTNCFPTEQNRTRRTAPSEEKVPVGFHVRISLRRQAS